MNRLMICSLFAAIGLSLSACAATITFEKVPLQVAATRIEVQVADTAAKRMRGLMEQYPVKNGMLLLNDEPREMILWMKNTPSDLDVAFIDASWRIVKISQMQANTETLHPSGQDVIGALEMPLNWFNRHQVNVGDKISNCERFRASCSQ